MASIKKYKYFIYSNQQYKERCKIEAEIGMTYIPGRVIKNGKWNDFTEMTDNPSFERYSDSKVVASGYINEMRYEQEKRVRKGK